MNCMVTLVLLKLFAAPLATGQCAIQPIKPIPPIGCKDLKPECVSDSNGQSHWTWICLPNNAPKDTKRNLRKDDSLGTAVSGQPPKNEVEVSPQESPIPQSQSENGIRYEMDAGEQEATERLRAIAETVKSCQPPGFPDGVFDSLASEGFKDVYGPPVNVVWNVQLHPSIRSRYIGEIGFGEPSYMQMPPTDSYCNKPKIDKKKCRNIWEAGVRVQRREMEHPLQFKYDFDVTTNGLELREVFKKDNRTEDDPWVAVDINADVCASKAIRSISSSPSKAVRAPMPAIMNTSQGPGQEGGHGASFEISAVTIGMTREVVLSGLASRYKLTKEDISIGPNSSQEVWLVEERSPSASADYWEVFFEGGRAESVITRLSPTLHADAVALAQQLFQSFIPERMRIPAKSQSSSAPAGLPWKSNLDR